MMARVTHRSTILASIFMLLACGTSRSDPWVLAPGDFWSDIRGGVFSADTYYNANGERPSFVGGGDLESRSLVWSNEIGWKKWASFRLDIPFESVTRRFEPAPDFPQTGLGDLVTGFKFKLLGGATAAALDASWKAPLGYNRHLFPALGNGFQEGIGALELGTEIRPLQAFVQVAGGYRLILDAPDDSLVQKDEVLASADVGWWLRPSLLLSGSYVARFESHDAKFPETVHQAGPQLLYRVDDNLDIFVGSLHTASGKNAVHIDRYYVGVAVKKTRFDRLKGFLGGTKLP